MSEPQTTKSSTTRPIYVIAQDIKKNWARVYFGAVPYLQAMCQLTDLKDMYGMDSAESVVLYFLSNASTWRGPEAKRIKAELKAILKAHGVRMS